MNYNGAGGLEFRGGNTKLDPNVATGTLVTTFKISLSDYDEALAKDCRVFFTEGHGVSFWSNTGHINVELADGTSLSFFIKIISDDVGSKMMHGECESMKAIHKLLPDFVPKPTAWGTYKSVPDTHIFSCHFRDMTDDIAGPDQFTERLAVFHQNSESLNGQFGFHITTYNGNLPQMNDWEPNWATYFSKSMRLVLGVELEAKGPDSEFDIPIPVLFEKVIHRLLRAVKGGGRSVKPSVIHGDLCYANSGIDVDTGESLIFDACRI